MLQVRNAFYAQRPTPRSQFGLFGGFSLILLTLTSTFTLSKNKYKLTEVILAQVVNYFIVVFLRLLAGITHPGDCK